MLTRSVPSSGGGWEGSSQEWGTFLGKCTHGARLTESRGSSAVQGSSGQDKAVGKWDALQRGRVNPSGFKSLTLSH